ncbi:diguanylate cyclase/phosphodiesterase [Luteibacter rhizovicinus]|uniref:Diguanylate cyclase/phosphodiesterase n=1 Tax=Luteibacter rhizovicinus TaxID=242606 RepID=A0A4R3YHK1_9GAMM|nr:EAL domain-containing protein [Luteibacter rhizovicinus]TCV91650.1 diguanylate cyclase/phosphodiesterase [Luteibacter rhizovicinus]
MRPLGFRARLGLFFVATLVIVQLLTAGLASGIARSQLIAEGGRQLIANADAFVAQMDDLSASVANSVQVMSLDDGLRSAIGAHDRETILSMLRNHGRRVDASRMQLIGLDGIVRQDTAGDAAPQLFPFPDLLKDTDGGRAAAVAVVVGKAYWVVTVPIHAPRLVGRVAVSIPVDDVLLDHMQRLSALPRDVELVTREESGDWAVVASGSSSAGMASHYRGNMPLPTQPTRVTIGGRQYLELAQPLRTPRGSPAVYALMGYSLDDALRPYRAVWGAWAGLLALGLGAGLIAAWLVARGVSRPVEALAEAARRIEEGDYRPPPQLNRRDEIGQLATAFSTMSDAVREREKHIRYQALHDTVTDLPNRAAAEDEIDEELNRYPKVEGALLMVGLTRLPDIVKTVGHALADRLMRDAGGRICRAAGNHLVARATDTQFVLWMGRADRATAIGLAFRILDALGHPYTEADVSIDMGPAIGIALSPEHGVLAASLLRRAEVAQFAAVGSTRGVDVYDPHIDPHRPERLSLMSELRAAIDTGGLELHYQPKLRLADGRIDAAEALIRWRHPTRGEIPPEDFIGAAEETGNIGRLTRWVLATAIAHVHALGERGHVLKISINLSARDLEDTELPDRVGQLLRMHGVPGSVIALEVTESAVIGEPAAALQVLRRLADMGIDIAIDDFGIGQSSFGYLRHLPVHELKIDKMFVQQLATDETDRTIVRSLVELGHGLGYEVTAEGVEDAAALDFLREIGCDHAQGFFVARAMDFGALTELCDAEGSRLT